MSNHQPGSRLVSRISPIFVLVVCTVLLCGNFGPRALAFQPPEAVKKRSVTIWSEGTRMAGDLYFPARVKEGEKLPAIVMSHGWGGVKRQLQRNATKFAEAGYVVLAFDYRGWGESDSKLVLKEPQPKPDAKGEATVRVQLIRDVVDPHDEAVDLFHAIDFIEGETGVDVNRIGLWGTSYSGGLVVWVAAHDDRVRCVVGQVPGMSDTGTLTRQLGNQRAIQIARGEKDPVPQAVDKVGNLRGTPHLAKMASYNAVLIADRIKVPTLIIDAEKEELFDRRVNGQKAYEIIKSKGNVPAKYHVVKGITHYGIYMQAFAESADLALEWFNEHLKGRR